MISTDLAAETQRTLSTPLDGLIAGLARRIGGSRAKEVERFIKFSFIGLLGFVIDFGALFVLQSTILPPVDALDQRLPLNVALATSISFVLAVTSNFTWNRFWTYPDSRSYSIRRQLAQFSIVSVIGWLARTAWITASYVAIGALSTAVISAMMSEYRPALLEEHKLGTMIAQFIGVIVVMIWNFLANRYWTFNDVD